MEACWAHNPEVDGSKPFSATSRLSSVGRAWDCSGKIILAMFNNIPGVAGSNPVDEKKSSIEANKKKQSLRGQMDKASGF